MIYHSHHSTSYKTRSLSDLPETVRDAERTLGPHLSEFDGIVVTGVSGLLVGAPLAILLKKPLLVLRKLSDNSHDGGDHFVNASDFCPSSRLLFVDDFVSGGCTQSRVRCRVEKMGWKLVGRYTYRENEYYEFGA